MKKNNARKSNEKHEQKVGSLKFDKFILDVCEDSRIDGYLFKLSSGVEEGRRS